MAQLRYFADTAEGTVELLNVGHYGNGRKPADFQGTPVGTKLVWVDGQGWTGRVRATRCIEMKSNPSRHECDARCLNATGIVMKCECSCGGKNHGRGSFVAEAA